MKRKSSSKKRTIKARLQNILKKLNSIEETPANAAKIRAIENKIDEVRTAFRNKA